MSVQLWSVETTARSLKKLCWDQSPYHSALVCTLPLYRRTYLRLLNLHWRIKGLIPALHTTAPSLLTHRFTDSPSRALTHHSQPHLNLTLLSHIEVGVVQCEIFFYNNLFYEISSYVSDDILCLLTTGIYNIHHKLSEDSICQAYPPSDSPVN